MVVETVRQELPAWTLAGVEGTPVRLLPAGAVVVGIGTVDARDLDAGLAAESRIVGDIRVLIVGWHADLVQRGDDIVEDPAGRQLPCMGELPGCDGTDSGYFCCSSSYRSWGDFHCFRSQFPSSSILPMGRAFSREDSR